MGAFRAQALNEALPEPEPLAPMDVVRVASHNNATIEHVNDLFREVSLLTQHILSQQIAITCSIIPIYVYPIGNHAANDSEAAPAFCKTIENVTQTCVPETNA